MSSNGSTLPWIEKYRPKKLDEIYSHGEVIATLKKFIKNKCFPHLLLYGPPGTGKTSCITACAKELYGKKYSYMVLELNASDSRGIEVVRGDIKDFVTKKGMFLGSSDKMFKLVILDETDAMTNDAQAILRKIIEEYTFNTRFCLICNYVQFINPALQSRCMKFRFSLLDKESMRAKLSEIAKGEGLHVTDNGYDTIIKRSNGDMRRACNIIQSVSMTCTEIDSIDVNGIIGHPSDSDMNDILNAMLFWTFKDTYNLIMTRKNEDGFSLNDIIIELHNLLVNMVKNDDYSVLECKKVMYILDKIRDIECNQYMITNDNIQIATLVGIFKNNI